MTILPTCAFHLHCASTDPIHFAFVCCANPPVMLNSHIHPEHGFITRPSNDHTLTSLGFIIVSSGSGAPRNNCPIHIQLANYVFGHGMSTRHWITNRDTPDISWTHITSLTVTLFTLLYFLFVTRVPRRTCFPSGTPTVVPVFISITTSQSMPMGHDWLY